MKKTFIMIRSFIVLTSVIIYTIPSFEIMRDEFNLCIICAWVNDCLAKTK